MMATKKISDEALNFVSGGDNNQTADDSRFLNVLLAGRPGQCDRYGATRIFFESHEKEIQNAWASIGVLAHLQDGWTVLDNRYLVNGQWVDQEAARQYAMKVTGVYLTRAQWDW